MDSSRVSREHESQVDTDQNLEAPFFSWPPCGHFWGTWDFHAIRVYSFPPMLLTDLLHAFASYSSCQQLPMTRVGLVAPSPPCLAPPLSAGHAERAAAVPAGWPRSFRQGSGSRTGTTCFGRTRPGSSNPSSGPAKTTRSTTGRSLGPFLPGTRCQRRVSGIRELPASEKPWALDPKQHIWVTVPSSEGRKTLANLRELSRVFGVWKNICFNRLGCLSKGGHEGAVGLECAASFKLRDICAETR